MNTSNGKRESGSLRTYIFLLSSLFLNAGASVSLTNGCVCLGDTLTYNCTVKGSFGGATIWRGTAFSDCSTSANEISLLHSRFMTDDGTFGVCNNGGIVGRSLGVEDNNYTSQLNVTVTSDVIGKTVLCVNEVNRTTFTYPFRTSINTTGPLPPPTNIFISAVSFDSRALTFAWSPVASDCSSLQYSILASNCGSCPTTTTNTAVTCTDVPTDSGMCTFAVQTVICGNTLCGLSDPLNFTLIEDNIYTQLKGNSRCTATITTTTLLSILLFLWVSVSTTIIIVLVRKAKVKVQEEHHSASTTRKSSNNMKERKLSAIDTRENAAYGVTVFD